MAGARPRHFLVSGRVALETLLCSLILSFPSDFKPRESGELRLFFLVIRRGRFHFVTLSAFLNVLDAPRIQASDTSIYQAVLAPRILGNTIPERRVRSLPCVKAREQCRPRWVSQNLLPKLALESGFIHFSFFFSESQCPHFTHCLLPSLSSHWSEFTIVLSIGSRRIFFFSSLAGPKMLGKKVCM